MSHHIHSLFVTLVLLLWLTLAGLAQPAVAPPPQATELSITIGPERVRFVALKAVQEVRLQVFQPSGALIFDTGLRPTPEFDWGIRDANGTPLEPGLYRYTFALHSAAAAAPSQHTGHFIVEQNQRQFWLTTKEPTEIGAEVAGGNLTAARTSERTTAGTDRQAKSRTATGSDESGSRNTTTDDVTAPATVEAAGVGTPGKIAKWVTADTLTDSILTQGNGFVAIDGHFALKGNMLKLRNNGDTNNIIQYNAEADGPEFRANLAFKWRTANGGLTERMRLTNTALSVVGNILANGNITANGDIISTRNMVLNNNALRLRSVGDANHGMLYNATVDGPEFRGFGGFRWTNGAAGATERMRLTATGNLNVSGVVSGQMVNAATQFNINGDQVLRAERSFSTNNRITIGRVGTQDEIFVPRLLIVNGQLEVGELVGGGAADVCREGLNQRLSSCSSSLRYKEAVTDFTAGLPLLNRLRPVSFTWKQGQTRDLGLIAEEVAAVEPLLATYNEHGEIEGVKYKQVSLVLINAVREQQQQLATLQSEQTELRARNAVLAAQLAAVLTRLEQLESRRREPTGRR